VRYLAIDLGDKRTGIALGDSITGLATPVDVVEVAIAGEAGEALLKTLLRVIEQQLGPAPLPGRGRAPGELVIGLPLNMDGTEGSRAALVRAFASRLEARSARRVHFQDERLSSAAADWNMARSGLTHKQKKARRDALAAAAILQDFLGTLPRPPTGPAAGPAADPATGDPPGR
jgi:putative holliday junction resolvase